MVSRIAVIGCAGFIGSHLVRRLCNEGLQVKGLDTVPIQDHIRSSGLTAFTNFTFRLGDYSNPEFLQWILDDVDVVVNLAALCNPSLYNTQALQVIESNLFRPAALVEACARKGLWLVHFSTSEIYGKTLVGEVEKLGGYVPESNHHQVLEEDNAAMLLGPVQAQRWSYAAAKQMVERLLVAWHQETNFPYTVVRPFNFIGPGMDYIPGVDGEGVPRVVACFMAALLRDEPLVLVDGGTNRRCFTWIGDAVDAVWKILQNAEASKAQVFNIGNPANETDMANLAMQMARSYAEMQGWQRYQVQTKVVPALDFYGVGYEDSDRRLPSVDKAKLLLNWKPVTGLQQSIQLTVEWFVQHYALQTTKGRKV